MEKLERASELINQNMGLGHNLNDNSFPSWSFETVKSSRKAKDKWHANKHQFYKRGK